MRKVGTVLLREQRIIITWKSVFLALCDDGVLQFCSRDGEPIKDVIRIDSSYEVCEVEMITITNKNHCFMVTGREKYIMCCESREESESWVREIREFIELEKMKAKNTRYIKNGDEERDREREGIVICSYNLNFGLCGGQEAADNMCSMLTTKADVIFLQETNDDWQKYIKYATGILQEYQYHCFHPAELPAGGIAVLSKFPITNKELIKSPVSWFPAQLVIVHTPQQDVQVLNLHLRPPLTDFPNPLPLPHAYISSKKDRVKECLAYSCYLDFSKPVVVLGDFNEDVGADSVKVWTYKLGMKNAYDKLSNNNNNNNSNNNNATNANSNNENTNANIDNNNNNNNENNNKSNNNNANNNNNITKEKTDITWHWELPLNITLKAKFDHIFYHNLECVKYGVKLTGASDHYPIFAHFNFILL